MKDVITMAVRAAAVVGVWAATTAAAATPEAAPPPASTPTSIATAGSGKPCGLPATGQVSTIAAGDDGSVRAGAPLSYADNGDGTITDRTTGLMWEKKVKLDGTRDPADLHDADNCYPWHGFCATGGGMCGTNVDCAANGPCNTADCQTRAPDGLTIFKWVSQLNAAKFAGHSDWRVPNVKELQSIVDYNIVNPAIAPAFHGASCGRCSSLADAACSCTQLSNYWSSTTYALPGVLDGAWVVYFVNGTVIFNVKHSTFFVRAVRGGM